MKKITVLDLFAGSGGLSEGFYKNGYDFLGHIEKDFYACNTLITRAIYHKLRKKGKLKEYEKYVLNEQDLDSIVTKYGLKEEVESVICENIDKNTVDNLIKKLKKQFNGKAVDIIIGGPPCQAYSTIGRSVSKNKMEGDYRNNLYKYYIKFLKSFKPKIFVFENVPGLITAGNGKYFEDMKKKMEEIGYIVEYQIIDSSEYGVPQARKRIILLGWNKNAKLTEYPNFKKVDRSYKVKNFLSDLPKLNSGGGKPLRKNFVSKNLILRQIGIVRDDFNILLDHTARKNIKRDLIIYKKAVELKKLGKVLKYNNLPKKLKTHKNENSFLDRFKVIDNNAKGSHTIVAHISKDGHYYIHPSITQNRSISVREAARLQTFPDDYKFEGPRTSQFQQIGNAVPPMLSYVIAKELKKYF